MDNTNTKKDYRGWTIQVNTAMEFEIVGVPAGLEETRSHYLRRTFHSFSSACDEINRAMELEKRAKAGHFKVSLALVDIHGDEFVATGVNRTDRTFLGYKAAEGRNRWIQRPNSTSGFPAVPWLVRLAKERQEHFDRIDEIDQILKTFEVEPVKGFGYGRIDAGIYENVVDDLKKRAAEMLLKAKAMADETVANPAHE